ncbi:MAG: FtsX-like permease family protein, partial [Anaerolineae bacterium]|nr:FtsX-like permease family protein [Anaerolineae bacterium]
GVQEVQAALIGEVIVENPKGEIFDTIAISIDQTNPFLTLKPLDGTDAFSSSDGVWIGHNVERVMDIHTGDTITLKALGQEKQVNVLGVVAQVMGAPVYVPRQLMLEWTPVFVANAALVRTENVNAVRDRAVSLPGMLAVESMADHEKDLNDYLLFFRTGTLIFGFFGYVLTLAVLYNTVSASLRERRDELAILRALGTSGREIFLTVTLELLVMAAVGIVIGIPLGREVAFYLTHNYDTDIYGSVAAVTIPSYVIGLVSLLLIILLGELPGLRALYQIDLGRVSKSQSI